MQVIARPFTKALRIILALLIAQRGTRPQKPILFVLPLLCNRAELQWRTQWRELCFFPLYTGLESLKHCNKCHAEYQRPKCRLKDVGRL